MKIGTSLFMLILCLIALGYLASDYIEVRKELNVASQQIEDLKGTNEQLSNQLVEVQKIVQDQKSQLVVLQSEKNTCQEILTDMVKNQADLKQQNQLLTAEVARLQGINQEVQDQGQPPLQNASNWLEFLFSILDSKSTLIVISLAVPSLAVTLPLVVRVRRMNKSKANCPESNSHILLTNQEIREVIRKRTGGHSC